MLYQASEPDVAESLIGRPIIREVGVAQVGLHGCRLNVSSGPNPHPESLRKPVKPKRARR